MVAEKANLSKSSGLAWKHKEGYTTLGLRLPLDTGQYLTCLADFWNLKASLGLSLMSLMTLTLSGDGGCGGGILSVS